MHKIMVFMQLNIRYSELQTNDIKCNVENKFQCVNSEIEDSFCNKRLSKRGE